MKRSLMKVTTYSSIAKIAVDFLALLALHLPLLTKNGVITHTRTKLAAYLN